MNGQDERLAEAQGRYGAAKRALAFLDEQTVFEPSAQAEAVEALLGALDDAAGARCGLRGIREKLGLWLDAFGEDAEPQSRALVQSAWDDLARAAPAPRQNARRAFSAAASVPSSR